MEEAKDYNVKFGPFLAENCKGVFNLVGRGFSKQPFRFREAENGKILMNCLLFDEEGNTAVKLHNSNPIYSLKTKEEYEITNEKGHIIIANKTTDEIWLDFKKIGDRDFRLYGMFYYKKCNAKVVITDEYITVNTSRRKNIKLTGTGKFVNCLHVVGILPDCTVTLVM